MATPKRVRKNDEKQYSDIYQENFIAQNDPAALGQAAFTRQLSNGIQRNRPGQERLAEDTNTAGVIPDGTLSPYGREDYQYATGGTPVFGPEQPAETVGPSGELYTGQNFQAGISQPGEPLIQMPGLSSIVGDNYDPRYGNIQGVGDSLARMRNERARYDEMTRRRQAEFDAIQARTRQAQAAERALQGETGLVDKGYRGPGLGFEMSDEQLGIAPPPVYPGMYGGGALRQGTSPGLYGGGAQRQPTAMEQAIIENDQLIGREQREAELYGNITGAQSGYTQYTAPGPTATMESEAVARRRAAEARAAQGEMILPGNTLPSLERITGDPYTPPTPAIPGEEDYTGAGLQPDYTGAGLQPDAMQRAREEEQQVIAEEVERDRLRREGDDTTPEPYDGPEGGGETDDDGNQITLSGATASYDNGITQEEERLTNQLIAEENAVLQNFNQKYNQFLQMAINRGAVRGDLESQGFTGGIGQQIKDYLSTQEIVALNQIIAEKDQALQAIDLERQNIPNLAKTNYIQSLQLESASLEAQNAFSQMISSKVLDGTMTLSEANGLAEQYGIQDVQTVFETAIEGQIAAGTMDKNTARAELERLGLDTSFLDDIGKVNFTDFSVSEEAAALEEDIKGILDDIGLLEESSGTDAARATTLVGSMALGAAIGTAIPVPIIGTVVGALAGLAFGTIQMAGAKTINSSDYTKVGSSLFRTEFMVEQGSTLMNGQFNSITIKKPAGQGNAYGGLGNTFVVNIDGRDYQMQGKDIAVLASVLKKKGYSQTDPRYKAIFSEARKAYEEYDEFGSFSAGLDTVLGNEYYVVKEMYESVFN